MTTPATPATPTTPSSMPRWRRILAGFLAVLACILFPVSVLAIWLHNTVLETDRYVETVAPLAKDPAIQNAIANRVSTYLADNVDMESEIKGALPKKAAFIAPYLATGIETFAKDATLKVVQSDQFATIWEQVNRRAHTQILAVLQGKGNQSVQTKNGQVVLFLGPLVDLVVKKLDAVGITLFDNLDVVRKNPAIVLIDSNDLTKVQEGVSLFNDFVVVLPIVTILCIAGAILLSPKRRKTALKIALGVVLGMGVLLVALNLGRSFYLDGLPETVNRAAATVVYDQLTTFLRNSLRMLFVLALVVAIGAWLAGPGGGAVRIRSFFLDKVRGQGNEGVGPQALTDFVSSHLALLRILVIGLAFGVVVLVSYPTPKLVIVLAILVIFVLLLLEFLARGAVAPPAADGAVVADDHEKPLAAGPGA